LAYLSVQWFARDVPYRPYYVKIWPNLTIDQLPSKTPIFNQDSLVAPQPDSRNI